MNEANETDTTSMPDWMILVVAVAVVCAILFGIGYWIESRKKTIVSSKTAGVMSSAQFTQGGAFSFDTTTIHTSKGTFVVYGIFQTIKGNMAVIETRRNGERFLCDHAESICKKLID